MKLKLWKSVLSVACIIGMLGANSIDCLAAGSSPLPSGGAGIALTGGSDLQSVAAVNDNSATIEALLTSVARKSTEEIEELSEEETFRNLVIAQVHDYVNVRDLPDEKKGAIIGKLYDDSVGELIEETENGWYKIQSGSCTGYVKAEFCVTGEDAIALAKEVGTRLATVTTTTLFVRKEATTESGILAMVPLGDDLVVVDETEGWVQVDTEEGLGWISTDYAELRTEFVKAESKEEEEKRLAREAEARRQANAAAGAARVVTPSWAITDFTVTGEGVGKDVAEYACQFVGNPYVWGGTSLTNGADCSGFVMSVYANFGVSLPHSSASDRSQGYAVEGGIDNAQAGDLICYSGHVAIYIGNGQIVHASNKKNGILVSKVNYRKILAIRRIF